MFARGVISQARYPRADTGSGSTPAYISGRHAAVSEYMKTNAKKTAAPAQGGDRERGPFCIAWPIGSRGVFVRVIYIYIYIYAQPNVYIPVYTTPDFSRDDARVAWVSLGVL